jgi:hypothetical protein
MPSPNITPIRLERTAYGRVAFEYSRKARFYNDRNFEVGPCLVQKRQSGRCQNTIAKGAQANNAHTRLLW